MLSSNVAIFKQKQIPKKKIIEPQENSNFLMSQKTY